MFTNAWESEARMMKPFLLYPQTGMTESPRIGVGLVPWSMRIRLCTPRWQMPVCLMLLQCILLAIGNKARVEVLHFNTRRAGKGFKSFK